VPAGACGWTNSIQFNGDDQDTHFDALQITMAKQLTHGLSATINYAWQRAYNWASSYATWDRTAVKGRDTSLREQQLVGYGTYELPFGKSRMVGGNVSTWVDEIIGHWQLSPILNYSSGLPFTLTYSGCSSSVPTSSAPCYPNGRGSSLPLRLGSYNPTTHNRFFYQGATVPLTTQPFSNFSAAPLDTIGNAGRNNVFGPHFFNMDLAVQKNFPIRENLLAQFRMDAYNVFNHINAGLLSTGCGPDTCGTIDQGAQFISQGPGIGGYTNPRQLQLSVRFQF
jgi:hypothetical protein